MQQKLSFGQAIEALKLGLCVTREGWNGKGMFVFMRPADKINIRTVVENVKSLPYSVKQYYDAQDDRVNPGEFGLASVQFTAYLCLKAADNTVVNGWLASQTDMLAEDWMIVVIGNTTYDGFPRRSWLEKTTSAEFAIYNAMQAVEKLPADVRLTKAVMLMAEAKELVGDFIDEKIAETTKQPA